MALTHYGTLRNQVECPLLRLPAELRLHIYGYLSVGNITVCDEDQCPTDHLATYRGITHIHYPRHRLHLLQVCQQIHAEAKALIFNRSCLTGHYLDVLKFLLDDRFNEE
jgi:hypothetical protein